MVLNHTLTIENAGLFTATIPLSDGVNLQFGPARTGDGKIIGELFLSLSKETRELYAPHPFTMEYAEEMCRSLDYSKYIPMIATDEQRSKVIAYFMLCLYVYDEQMRRYQQYGIELDKLQDTMLAPVVRDGYQGQGIAGRLMSHYLKVAKLTGRRYLTLYGGTQARNERGRRLYEKAGFKEVGRFPEDEFNIDMMLDLRKLQL